ncbi:MAG: phosphatase PAP2 family protein [Verrucomicrobiales bacterium]
MSRSTILLTLLGLALSACLFPIDPWVGEWVRSNVTKDWRDVMGPISKFFDWPGLMVIGASLWLLFRFVLKNPIARRVMVVLMIGSTLAGLSVNVLRLTTGRTRPNNTQAEQGFYGLRHEGRWLIGSNRFNSFPSGHTATAVGFVVPLLWISKAWAVPGIILALSVIVSRLTLGVHHPTDVAFSIVISTLVCWLAWQRWGRSFVMKADSAPPA